MEGEEFRGLDVHRIWKQSERYKEESVEAEKYRKTIYPPIAWFVPSWEKQYLTPADLERLQIFITPYMLRGERQGSLDIFSTLLTAKAGEIAAQMQALRESENPKITKWISGVTDEIKEAILNETIPPVMILTPVGLDYGNIPDGNHRVLAALDLAKDNSDIKIPAFVGKLPEATWIVYNSAMLVFGTDALNDDERSMFLKEREFGGNTLPGSSSDYDGHLG